MRSPCLLNVLLQAFEEKHKIRLQWAQKQRQALGFWRAAVGEKYALFSSAIKLRKTLQPPKLTLVVAVSQWEWKLELSHHKGAVLKKYKKRFPTLVLDAVHFKYVPELPSTTSSLPTKAVSLTAPAQAPSKIFSSQEKKSQTAAEPLAGLRETVKAERMRLLRWKKKTTKGATKTSGTALSSFAFSRSALQEQLEKRHPEFGIRSSFLNPPDELQPFELYD